MNETNYNKLKTKDYLLIGRRDAWTKDNDLLNRVNQIIELIDCDTNNMFEKIRNYILGYKIGKLEMLLSKFEDIICFDFRTQEFYYLNGRIITATSFKSGYNNFENEANEQAKKILEIN